MKDKTKALLCVAVCVALPSSSEQQWLKVDQSQPITDGNQHTTAKGQENTNVASGSASDSVSEQTNRS